MRRPKLKEPNKVTLQEVSTKALREMLVELRICVANVDNGCFRTLMRPAYVALAHVCARELRRRGRRGQQVRLDLPTPPDGSRRAERRSRCTVFKDSCAEHGFIHGAEASELREGIEKIIEDYGQPENDTHDGALLDDLQRLLDTVDARDSLARLEAQLPEGSS